jgi:hypothetical protein
MLVQLRFPWETLPRSELSTHVLSAHHLTGGRHMDKPWLAHYEKDVPHTIDYPRIPLHRTLEDSAARLSRPDSYQARSALQSPLTMGVAVIASCGCRVVAF